MNSFSDAKCGNPFRGRAGKSHCLQFVQQCQSCQKPALHSIPNSPTPFPALTDVCCQGTGRRCGVRWAVQAPERIIPKRNPRASHLCGVVLTQPSTRLFLLFLLKTPKKPPACFFPHSCCCSLAEVKYLGKPEP